VVRNCLKQNAIPLISLHEGWDPNAPFGQLGGADLDHVIDFALVTETPFIVVSGRDRGGWLASKADSLNVLGEKCRQRGVTLCYHNHFWEISDEAQVLRDIAQRTEPGKLSFCPDIGQIRKVTPRVMETLRIIESRIRLVHLKDFLTDDPAVRRDETEFGKGIVNFDEMARYLKGLPQPEMWVFAEQGSSAEGLTPEETIRANHKFLARWANK
jgi:sugar phosphate isomerase/epimerase